MKAIRRSLRERLIDAPLALHDWLTRYERPKRVMYEIHNRRLFSNLIEHDEMLADRVRTEAYWAAIERHIGAGDVVIDLGAGTGVLSMFAARQGAHVHAVEHGPIIDAARAVASANGVDSISFHRVNSRRFELDREVDAIVHEQLGNALFDERVVENVADLRDRLLKPGGRIYPSVLDLYIEPVQIREDMRTPFAWQQRLHGVDFSAIEAFTDMSHSYLYRCLRPFPLGHFLCNPSPVLSVDLHTVTPADLPTRISYAREVESPGYLDGYCIYFDARFDDEIWFTSSPHLSVTNWSTPFLRVAPRWIEPGERIKLQLTATDLAAPQTWRWAAAEELALDRR